MGLGQPVIKKANYKIAKYFVMKDDFSNFIWQFCCRRKINKNVLQP